MKRHATKLNSVRIHEVKFCDIPLLVNFCIKQDKPRPLLLEAATLKTKILKRNFSKLWAFIAQCSEEVVGILESYPLSFSATNIKGRNYAYLKCLWVSHKWCGQGIGRRLIAAAEVQWQHLSGVVVRAWRPPTQLSEEEHMPMEFFEKLGFQAVSRFGPIVMMVKKFRSVPDPIFVLPSEDAVNTLDSKVRMEFWSNNLCPYNYYYGRMAWEACKLLQDRVNLCLYHVNTRHQALRLGHDGMDMQLLLDGKNVLGKPMNIETLKRKIYDKFKEKGKPRKVLNQTLTYNKKGGKGKIKKKGKV